MQKENLFWCFPMLLFCVLFVCFVLYGMCLTISTLSVWKLSLFYSIIISLKKLSDITTSTLLQRTFYHFFQDYIDAFEKLIRLNLKDVQTREVIHVLIDCCIQVHEEIIIMMISVVLTLVPWLLIHNDVLYSFLSTLDVLQEKMYNPYYAFLGQKFCENSRSYQVHYLLRLSLLFMKRSKKIINESF